MATPMIRDHFEAITNLEAALRAVFFDQLSAVNEPGSDLFRFFNVQASMRAAERNQGVGGFGDVPVYTGTLEYESFELLYQKSYEHVEFAKGMAVERRLIDDDEYNVINQRARLFGMSFDRKRYKDAASVFNNAFSSSYVGGDAVALCATNHPYSPSDASTQSNKGTSALTYDAVVATEQAMMSFVDSKGNPMDVMPDTLIVPLALRNTALTIAGSPLRPGTANNDINPLAYNVVVSRYLTDANNWFLVDSRLATQYLNWFDRVRPEYTADPTSDYKLEAKFRGYMRYSFGWDAWQWIYGHEVA